MALTDQPDGPRRRTLLWLGAAVAVGLLVGGFWAMLRPADAVPLIANGPPTLVEQAVAAGLDHTYDGEFSFFVGGGVAVTDCDDDGFPDVYLAGGTNAAALYRNDSGVGGELSFVPLPNAVTDMEQVVGAYPIDIDGDGHKDLAVLRRGENVLLRGLGDCRFERANEQWQFDGGNEWTTAFSATWEQPGAMPTLAFGNYLEVTAGADVTQDCAASVLVRPGAERYADPIELSPGYCALSVLFSDWNRSGLHDLRITNDRHYYTDGQDQLWNIAVGAAPRLYTEADGWRPLEIWGMGIAATDVTGDGLPEFYLTSQGDNKLQTLEAGASQPIYRDIAIRRGVTAHRPFTGDDVLPSTAWHPEFQDINNDTIVDLYVSKGNVEAMPEYAAADPSNLLIGQPDGTFVESALDAGMISFGRSRGAAIVDFNLDGMLDIIEVNRRENVKLWRSMSSQGNHVAVRLHQPGGNADGIGALIQVRVGDRVMERELTIGGGHASGQLGWVHFGIGDTKSAEARVIWPDGEEGPWLRFPAPGFFQIERGADSTQPWLPESS